MNRFRTASLLWLTVVAGCGGGGGKTPDGGLGSPDGSVTSNCLPQCLAQVMLTNRCRASGACMTAGTNACFANGVKFAAVAGMSTVTGTDGALCYTIMVMVSDASDMASGVFEDASGNTFATITFSRSNTNIWNVTCAGSQTVTTIDVSTTACQQEYPSGQTCMPGTCA